MDNKGVDAFIKVNMQSMKIVSDSFLAAAHEMKMTREQKVMLALMASDIMRQTIHDMLHASDEYRMVTSDVIDLNTYTVLNTIPC